MRSASATSEQACSDLPLLEDRVKNSESLKSLSKAHRIGKDAALPCAVLPASNAVVQKLHSLHLMRSESTAKMWINDDRA